MEKSGEKIALKLWRNGLLAGRSDKGIQSEFAEQTHEYNEVVRMAFRDYITNGFRRRFQRKVVSITLFYFESLQAFAFSI